MIGKGHLNGMYDTLRHQRLHRAMKGLPLGVTDWKLERTMRLLGVMEDRLEEEASRAERRKHWSRVAAYLNGAEPQPAAQERRR